MAVAVAGGSERVWTYDDLKELPDDGRRWEIVEGMLVEMTGPSWDHATIVQRLLMAVVPLVAALGGIVRSAPLDVFLRAGDVVQPDLFVVLPGGVARPTPRGLEGPPDLVVEVVSPSNRQHDELTKRSLYGLAGVREYWLVDPEARSVEVLELHRDAMHLRRRFTEGETVVSSLLPGAAISLADLFAGTGDNAEGA